MVDVVRRALGAAAALLVTRGTAAAAAGTAAQFRLPLLEGGELDLAAHAGQPMLVVNTASLCGFTPQYAGLQRLHEQYGPRGLLVIGTPSNDFRQEHAGRAEVRAFCDARFGITFPLTDILHVRGAGQHPFWRWLSDAAGSPPRWNFKKYLVARNGVDVQAFATMTEPDAPVLRRAVEAALG